MSVESWKSLFDVLTVVLLGLTFVAGAGVLVAGNIINSRQSQKLTQFDADLTNAKSGLASQQERAATAEGKIASLQKDASDARSTQQRVEIDLSKQKERTAAAEKYAADAALELAKFRAPRTLSPEQQDMLIAALKPFAGQHYAFAVFPDPEPLALLRMLDVNLKSAGWERVPSQIERPGGVLVEAAGNTAATVSDAGIDVYIASENTTSVSAQSAVCTALRNADLACETHRTPQLTGKTPIAITISVGKKL